MRVRCRCRPRGRHAACTTAQVVGALPRGAVCVIVGTNDVRVKRSPARRRAGPSCGRGPERRRRREQQQQRRGGTGAGAELTCHRTAGACGALDAGAKRRQNPVSSERAVLQWLLAAAAR
eukprot:360779-Chlamydomonas_euryale.AAC.5